MQIQPILRGSDVLKDIDRNRPFFWADDYHAIGIAFAGGGAAYLVGSAILYGINPLCAYDYAGYFFEKAVDVICTNDMASLAAAKVTATCAGVFGTFFYSVLRDGGVYAKEGRAKQLIGDPARIIGQSDYKKLREIMHPNLSTDLNTHYLVPKDKDIREIVEREKKALNEMFENMFKENSSFQEIYKKALKQQLTAVPITEFLESKLNNDTLKAIYYFATKNKLQALIWCCEDYYKAHKIELVINKLELILK